MKTAVFIGGKSFQTGETAALIVVQYVERM
jgi:hypothetical protein